MLELAILGLLKERPMHGYDLRKRLRDELGPFSNLSFGSLYPALGRLEKAGALLTLTVADEPAGAADDASQLGRRSSARAAAALGGRGTRARKVYDLTEQGELLFEELLQLNDGGDDPRGFLLRLGLARHLTPGARVRLLERRRVQLLDRVARARRLLGSRGSGSDRYSLAILEHSLELALADLDWVERLLAEEASGAEADGAGAAVTAGRRAPTGRGRGVLAPAGASVGGISGILHAGRLRRRPDGARPAPQQSTRPKEQIDR